MKQHFRRIIPIVCIFPVFTMCKHFQHHKEESDKILEEFNKVDKSLDSANKSIQHHNDSLHNMLQKLNDTTHR